MTKWSGVCIGLDSAVAQGSAQSGKCPIQSACRPRFAATPSTRITRRGRKRRIDAPAQSGQDIVGGPLGRNDEDQQTGRWALIQVLGRDELPIEHAFDPSQNAVQFGQRGTSSTELNHVGAPSEQAEVTRVHQFDHVAEPMRLRQRGPGQPLRPARHPTLRG